MKDKLLNANFPKTAEGRVYHVEVKRGEVANRIITVGDLSRAELFAESLDKDTPIFKRHSARGFFTFTGKYKGVPVSIMGIGMGYPMMDIFVRETRAAVDGQLIIIRFGSCGIIGKGAVGHMVVPKGAFAVTKNFDYFYNYYEDPDVVNMTKNEEMEPYNVSKVISADQEICELLQTKLLNYLPANEIHTGLNATCDGFYSSQGREDDNFADHNEELFTYIKKKHPLTESLEMETFMLFHLAKCSNDAPLINREDKIDKIDKTNEVNEINPEVEVKYDENIITTVKKPKNSIRAAATMMVFTDRKTDEFIDPSRTEYLESMTRLAVLDVLVSIKLEEEQDKGVWDLIN